MMILRMILMLMMMKTNPLDYDDDTEDGRKRRRFTSEEEAWYFKDMSRMLPGLARIEGVGGPGDRGCISEVRPVFRGRSIFRHSFFILFFYCFLSQFVFHFDGFCDAILAFKKDPNGSSGPSWRILAASWLLFRVIPTQKSASTRLICFC